MNEYLQSKKLTFNDWMAAVKNHRHGDIVCVYLLSMVTGNHTAIHLKNNKIWCTLKAVPLLHYELVECCPIHLVYVTQLRSREDPELQNTLKNASYQGGWAAKCFKYSPTKGDGGVRAIWSSPGYAN